MEENNKKEIDNECPEYKAGFSAGTFAVHVVVGCGCALLIGITFKILQWMLF